MYHKRYTYSKLPDGWQKCVGIYKTIKSATEMAKNWNKRNDEYYYKIFPKFRDRETSYMIARKLKSEIGDQNE